LFLQDGDETTMALKTMPIAKLQDLKAKIEVRQRTARPSL